MSEIKYGLISETDARTLEKTMDLICDVFADFQLNICEIGIFNGDTTKAMHEYFIIKKKRLSYHTAIDSEKDKPIENPLSKKYCDLIIGNSSEVYNQLEDNSQHLIFVDGCHCFAHVISDFFCYADKVKVGGYIAFHDTGKHIKPFKDFQHGDKENPDAYISVRKALDKIGLFRKKGYAIDVEALRNIEGVDKETAEKLIKHYEQVGQEMGLTVLDFSPSKKWELIFDEADPTDEAGGICVFKKLY